MMFVFAEIILLCLLYIHGCQSHLLDGTAEPYPNCDNKFAAPCSVTFVHRMVNKVQSALEDKDVDDSVVLDQVLNGDFNPSGGVGFAPFVLNGTSLVCLSHGNGIEKEFVGKSIEEIFLSETNIRQHGIGDLIRSHAFGEKGENNPYFEYVWNSKNYLGYAKSTSNQQYIIFSGYGQRPLDVDKFCDTNHNGRCSILNVRSLVGDALTSILKANSLDKFYRVINELNYDPRYRFDSYYVFMYSYTDETYMEHGGINVALGGNPKFVGWTIDDIFRYLKVHEFLTGRDLGIKFVRRVENGGGFADYDWKIVEDDPMRKKVSMVMGVEKFGLKYYLGVGVWHVRQNPIKDAHCKVCIQKEISSCGFSNLKALVAHAETELLTDVAEDEIFKRISSEKLEFTMPDGFHVFIYDYSTGLCVADSLNGENVGRSVSTNFKTKNGDELHNHFIGVANSGGWFTQYKTESDETVRIAFIVRVFKFGKDFYLGSTMGGGISDSLLHFDDDCSAHYAGTCSESRVVQIVGMLRSMLYLTQTQENLDQLFSQKMGNLTFGNHFYPIIVDEFGFIHFHGLFGDEARGKLFADFIISKGITTMGSTFMENLFHTGFHHGGGWMEYEENSIQRKAFVASAEFKELGSTSLPRKFIIFSSFIDRPQPPSCKVDDDCPQNSVCNDVEQKCVCGYYFQEVFTDNNSNKKKNEQDEVCEIITKSYDFECAFNQINKDIQVVKQLCIVMFLINVTIAVFTLLWALRHYEHPVIRAAQPPFLLLVSIGTIVSSLSIYFFTIDDYIGAPANEYGGNTNADFSCTIQIYLYCTGFCLTFSSLFAKLYRVNTLFLENGVVNIKPIISTGRLFQFISAIVAGDLIILITWSLVDPLYFSRGELVGEKGIITYATCSSTKAWYFLSTIAIYHFVLLVFGNYYAYKTRKVNSVFSEAKYVQIAMISNLQVLCLSIPLLIMVSSEDQRTNMFLRSGSVFLNDLSVQLLIFLPKLHMIKNGANSVGIGGDIASSILGKHKKPKSKSKSYTVSASSFQTNQPTECIHVQNQNQQKQVD